MTLLGSGSIARPIEMALVLFVCFSGSLYLMAQKKKIRISEVNFTRDEIYIADEAFFTGTAAEVTPIKEVDKRIIGNGKPGPITGKLQDLFFKIVKGEDKAYKSWLTYI